MKKNDVSYMPQNYKELFNLRHAQARNVIERIFGVLRKRFPIIVQAPEFSLAMQSKLVVACCVLHNFIRVSGGAGDYFDQLAVRHFNFGSGKITTRIGYE